MIDLGSAADRMAELVRGVSEDQLEAPTPCPDYTLGDLCEHVGGLTIAFTAAATKTTLDDEGSQGPSGDASRLETGWRDRVIADLDRLTGAWRDPEAWTGMTNAGGVDLPGEVAGLVALDELVVHGWDIAVASGQRYECDPASLEAVHAFVQGFSGPGQEASREGLFGPVIDVPSTAPLLDRVLGLAGRDPSWSPS